MTRSAPANLGVTRNRPRLKKHFMLRYPLIQQAIATNVANLEAIAVPMRSEGTKPLSVSSFSPRDAEREERQSRLEVPRGTPTS